MVFHVETISQYEPYFLIPSLYPMGQDSERHLKLLYSERVMNTEDWIYWSRKSRLYSGEVLYCQRSGCARLFQSARDLG